MAPDARTGIVTKHRVHGPLGRTSEARTQRPASWGYSLGCQTCKLKRLLVRPPFVRPKSRFSGLFNPGPTSPVLVRGVPQSPTMLSHHGRGRRAGVRTTESKILYAARLREGIYMDVN